MQGSKLDILKILNLKLGARGPHGPRWVQGTKRGQRPPEAPGFNAFKGCMLPEASTYTQENWVLLASSRECAPGVCARSVCPECVPGVCARSVYPECVPGVCTHSVYPECVPGVCTWSVYPECVPGVCPMTVCPNIPT
ncbi:hypothetical protein DPMN_089571 [Dreissena polymorpha]|uniref:Uncharacterized protein n=1 Tax=Dreissena polymorpha TaxID=45954 RepID=A0A9D4KW77_DREPO|nr:hypothetical protein DPMN_089571 [Dreissena polymorpha]